MKYALSGLIFVSALIGLTLWSSTSGEMAQIPYEDATSVAAGKKSMARIALHAMEQNSRAS